MTLRKMCVTLHTVCTDNSQDAMCSVSQ